jgi:hypothetical protein
MGEGERGRVYELGDVKLSKAGLQAAMAQAKKSRKAAHKVKSTLQALDG